MAVPATIGDFSRVAAAIVLIAVPDTVSALVKWILAAASLALLDFGLLQIRALCSADG